VEPIGQILKRLTEKGLPAGVTATWSRPEPAAPPVCPICGGKGYLRREVSITDPLFGEPVPCQCKVSELRERRIKTVLERSNMDGLREQTFERFYVDEKQQKAYARSLAFAERPDGWLILMGDFGTGKTHLAAAIVNHRLDRGEPAIFIVVPDLLDHLRNTFSPSHEASYDDLFESVRTAPLLVLDDLGTQQTTPWAQEKLFQILNWRYNRRLPTVITTNKSLDAIGGAVASRMADPQIATSVLIQAMDYRGGNRNAAPAPDYRARRARQRFTPDSPEDAR